ncbi:MAG TPA: ATP-dependent DNA helicase, partial [Rhizomicrobium sp.]|nr:ATP-dependent DNA helicase [Rhizomicrobium sp.]
MDFSQTLSVLPALVPAPPGAVIFENGTTHRAELRDARALLESGEVLVAHAGFTAGRVGAKSAAPYDVIELFAFVRPGQPFVPSAGGMARLLGLGLPATPEESAAALPRIALQLLREVAQMPADRRAALAPLAGTMGRAGWRWAGPLIGIVGEVPQGSPIAGLEVWRGLPLWEDEALPGQPGSQAVAPAEAKARLAQLVSTLRPEQAAYSEAATHAFAPREVAGAPKMALIEAGTGTGKTLGYLAPASIWAEKNGPGLWISTYTRNLQRQIVQEIAHLWPDPVERAEKAVVRKGRENYLCLLNFEEAAKRTALAPGQRTVALALIARWTLSHTDGDLSGVGFPAFLAAYMPLSTVTDRRGECIYAACPYYRQCFIERAIRRARHASIVVANHALVIAQASTDWLGEDETTDTPSERRLRYVFDEGHHLFDAADSGFSAMLSGREMAELRRWIRGPEARARTRMRGLEERLKDLIADDEAAQHALEDAVQAAAALAGEGWTQRLGGNPRGPGETFLAAAYGHVRARSSDADAFYSLEAEPFPMGDTLMEAVRDLARGLKRIADPLANLARLLRKKNNDKTATLEPYTKARLEAAARGLERRAKAILPAWIAMLDSLEQGEIADEFVDWFEIQREDGRDADVGLKR